MKELNRMYIKETGSDKMTKDRKETMREMTFVCPFCGAEHNILEWIDGHEVDNEELIACLDDGLLQVSFPYVQCECEAEYVVEIGEEGVRIYDDTSTAVFEEEW